MIKMNLENMYKKPSYPKKGVFKDLDPDARMDFHAGTEDIYSAIGFGTGTMDEENSPSILDPAFRELKNCMNEEKPAQVALANFALLFWGLKGPNYNYGGFKEWNTKSVKYAWLNRNYITASMYRKADQTRRFLEQFGDRIMPQLANSDPVEYPKVELVYTKLLLLIYDLCLEAVVCEERGGISSSRDGYSAYTDSLGTTTISEKKTYHDSREIFCKTSRELCGEEKFQALLQGRDMLAAEIQKTDPAYPAEYNTWQYFRTDMEELRSLILPVYAIALRDCTREEKREEVVMNPKLVSAYGGILSTVHELNPLKILTKGYDKAAKDFMGEYRTGRIGKDEVQMRSTIYLEAR